MKTATLFLALPALALAKHDGRSRTHSQVAHDFVARSNSYKLVQRYAGQNFFDSFNFFTGADPTGGTVNFLSKEQAMSQGLAYVQHDNTTVLAVDAKTSLSPGKARDSIRVSSKQTFDKGLFIADFYALPHGCGAWPAYWTLGTTKQWPEAGEIDLVEATHNSPTSQVTIHTGPGCNWNSKPKPLATTAAVQPGVPFTGQIVGETCVSSPGADTGCGVRTIGNNSFGQGFNRQAGGVIAHRMDDNGIAVWQFARDEIPKDITAGTPNPAGWPTPVALFTSEGCDIATHFQAHTIILDITLGGDFGRATFANSDCPGTLEDAIANPANFKFAKFEIASISVYQ